jgi:hypothetical protein
MKQTYVCNVANQEPESPLLLPVMEFPDNPSPVQVNKETGKFQGQGEAADPTEAEAPLVAPQTVFGLERE